MNTNVLYKKAVRQNIFGVNYTHIQLDTHGDLYVTDFGIPFIDCLLPENYWLDKEWFRKNSAPLSGSSTLYKVTTRPVNQRSKEIVLKWNRMGQEVFGLEDEASMSEANFNSPFEEFSLVMELRRALRDSGTRLFTHKPLAIYTPAEKIEPSRTGRNQDTMRRLIETHGDIELDMHRTYAVIYEWLKGMDAIEAGEQGLLDDGGMRRLTLEAEKKLSRNGFLVRDRKPHHIIIRPVRSGGLLKNRAGDILYGLVDFELLSRTPDYEQRVKAVSRKEYLRRQRDRFSVSVPRQLDRNLHHVNLMGVDYICGRAESTGGYLWVVGKDPQLFDYFLPERWEKTPRTRLSGHSEVYHTLTKDNINLVWKISNVGILPDMDPFKRDEKRIIEFGYNSPFEEIALAMILTRQGIATIYPRAIYMSGSKTFIYKDLVDRRRYESHRQHQTPEGSPVLRDDKDYVLIWGYWNGPDEKLADEDANYYHGISALRAFREDRISEETYMRLMEHIRKRLLDVGIEDLNLRGSHLLLSILSSTGHLIMSSRNIPEIRISNFELLRQAQQGR